MSTFAGAYLRPYHRLRRYIDQHIQLLLRIAMIAGVIGAAFVLGRKPSLLYLAPFVGIVALLVYMRWPALGVLLTLIGGMAVPFYGPSGLNVTMLGMALLVGIWLMDMLVVKRRISLVSPPFWHAAALLSGAAILSFLVGLLPWYSAQHAPLGAQIVALVLYILSAGVALMMANQIKTLGGLKLITWGFLAYSSLYVVGYQVGPIGELTNRIFVYGSLGSLFWAWLAIMAFSQALVNRSLPGIVRMALLALTAATFYIIYVPQNEWKSGWVPAAVGIAVVLALFSWRLGAVMALFGLVPAAQMAQRALTTDAYSYSTRLEAWQIVGEIVKVNPILGLGPANYYWYTPLFPIRGYFVNFNSHNQYVDLVAQIGLVGLAAYAWFFFVTGRIGWQLYRASIRDDFARAYVVGALAGLVATIVAGFLGDWVLPFFYNVGLAGFRSSVLAWLFLGGMVAIANMPAVVRPEAAAE